LRLVFCALLLFHCTALAAANLPKGAVPIAALRSLLDGYVELLGQNQRWAMFKSAPRYLDLEAHTVARWADGETRRYNALLPGFAEYKDALRLDAFFARSLPTGRPGRDAKRYHAAMCRAVAEQAGTKPDSIQLVIVGNMLQPLDVVRQTRAMAEARTEKGEPQPCR
jgi:hypothetical protein